MTIQSKDVAAIKKLAEDWRTGWDRSDTEALLSLFTDDPVLMPQGQPAVTGKIAIRALYQSFFKEFTVCRVRPTHHYINSFGAWDAPYNTS